jgi:hypothetical protein
VSALEITTWPSLNATRPGRRRTISWEVLVAWLGLPWPEFAGDFQQRGWSPGTFTAHHRAGDCVELLHALGLDLDHCETVQQALRPWAGLRSVWHTTRRHMQGGLGPRLRVIVSLSRPVSRDEYRELWCYSNEHCGGLLDAGTKDPSRFWYCPGAADGSAVESGEIVGQPMPVDVVLGMWRENQGRAREPKAERTKAEPVDGTRHERYAAAALDREVSEVENALEGARNRTLNNAALALGQLVGAGALTRSVVEGALMSAAKRCGLPEREAERTIASGLGAGEKKPRALPEPTVATRKSEPQESGQAVAGEDTPEAQQAEAPATAPVLPRTLGQALPGAFALARRRQAGEELPVPVPWLGYAEALCGGFWPGCHVLVSGTGMGKTQAALQVSREAIRQGVPVAYVGLELDEEQVALRIAGEQAGMRWSHLYTGHATPEEIDYAEACCAELHDSPYYIETGDSCGWAPSRLSVLAEQLRRQHTKGPILVVVDFLQLISDEPDQHGRRLDVRERVGRASYLARDVARRFGVSVLLISSAARDKYSLLGSDLKEAGLCTKPLSNGHGSRRTIMRPDCLIGLGKESGEIEFSADSVTVLARWPVALDNGEALYICAVPKVRYRGAGWFALAFGRTFSEYHVESMDDLPTVERAGGRASVSDDVLRGRILETVAVGECTTRREVVAATDGSDGKLYRLLKDMIEAGEVVLPTAKRSNGGRSKDNANDVA